MPFTTKDELREGQRRDPPFGPHLCAPPERLVRMHVTSGTTGEPVAVGFTRRDHEANSAVGGEAFRIAGLRPDDIVAHCLNYALYAGGIADHMAIEASGATVLPVGIGQSRRLLELIPRLGITALFGTLSFPAYLAARAREAGIEPRELGLRHIVTAGEPGAGLAAVRRGDREQLGRERGRHVRDERRLVHDGRSVRRGRGRCTSRSATTPCSSWSTRTAATPLELEDGAGGELVWTHLRREASPLLRYRSGDLGAGVDLSVRVRARRAAHPDRRPSRRHAARPGRERLPAGHRRHPLRRRAAGAPLRGRRGRPDRPAAARVRRGARRRSTWTASRERLHEGLGARFDVARLEPGSLPVAEQKTRIVHRTARGDALPQAVETAQEGDRHMTVTTADLGAGRLISWDRQARRNAWDLETMTAIADAIEAASADSQVRCIVLRGAGDHFSAGDDLHSALEADSAAWAATMDGFQRLTRVVLAAAVPAIAAVDGVCVGGALEFAASCDLRLCTDRVLLMTPEVGIGLVASNAGTLLLPEVLGESAARELLLGGEPRDGAWAERAWVRHRTDRAGGAGRAHRALGRRVLGHLARGRGRHQGDAQRALRLAAGRGDGPRIPPRHAPVRRGRRESGAAGVRGPPQGLVVVRPSGCGRSVAWDWRGASNPVATPRRPTVDTSKLTIGDQIAAASGAVLLIALFLPWYGVDVSAGAISVSDSASAWEALDFIDILLFLISLVAIGVPVAKAMGALPAEVPGSLLVLAAGGLGVLLVLFRLVDLPTPDLGDQVDFSRKFGLFLGLLATVGVAYGGWRANEEAPASSDAGRRAAPSGTAALPGRSRVERRRSSGRVRRTRPPAR